MKRYPRAGGCKVDHRIARPFASPVPLSLSLHAQTIARHSERQNVAARLGNGLDHRFLRALFDHHQDAATTARAADLGRTPAILS